MRERELENYLVRETAKGGALALKFAAAGASGMPDRLLLLPGGRSAFVEVKAPGQKPRPLQEARHRALRDLGHLVFVVSDREQVIRTLTELGLR